MPAERLAAISMPWKSQRARAGMSSGPVECAISRSGEPAVAAGAQGARGGARGAGRAAGLHAFARADRAARRRWRVLCRAAWRRRSAGSDHLRRWARRPGSSSRSTRRSSPARRIAITRPGYPGLRQRAGRAGLRAVEIPVTAAQWLAADGRRHRGGACAGAVRGAAVCSPANPTGAALTREQLGARSSRSAKGSACGFISDEIYHGLDYRGPSVERAGAHARRDRDQQFHQILLHDRLAHRLDGGAGATACAARRCCSRTSSSRRRR